MNLLLNIMIKTNLCYHSIKTIYEFRILSELMPPTFAAKILGLLQNHNRQGLITKSS